MQVAGIISEFNPFHKGHRYLVDTVRRELQPDGIVVVMSGPFVQRGEPAMWDKWTRTTCALENGVDLVLELPVCYAVNSGEEFARGGIGILQGIGIVTDLAFGSETANREDLESAAESLMLESPLFGEQIRSAVRKGMSYPAAYERAALFQDKGQGLIGGDLLRGANDILALEYIKQMKRTGADFNIFPVLRRGAGHDRPEPGEGYASASSLRKMAAAGKPPAEWSTYIPEETRNILSEADIFGSTAQERYFAILRHLLVTRSASELSELISVGEGLENRLKQAVIRSLDTDGMIHSIKSKRYTYARIARILVQAFLSMDKEGYERIRQARAFYGRVLGFNDMGAKMLSRMRRKSEIPIFTNIRQADHEAEAIRQSLAWDCRAQDAYSILCGHDIYSGSDRVRKPCFVGAQSEKICTPNGSRV